MANVETWKNATKGVVWVVKFDRFGNEQQEVIPAGRAFSLAKDERLINQDRAADENLDVFSNGMLVPVRLLEGDEDALDIANNPNLMGETDMGELFKQHWKTFEAKVAKINNESTLLRLRDMADTLDASVKQAAIIEARIKEVAPASILDDGITQVGAVRQNVDSDTGDEERITGKAMTPK